MNAQAILTAMLPEHLLLVGIVLTVILEFAGKARHTALPVALFSVAAAAVAAAWLALAG